MGAVEGTLAPWRGDARRGGRVIVVEGRGRGIGDVGGDVGGVEEGCVPWRRGGTRGRGWQIGVAEGRWAQCRGGAFRGGGEVLVEGRRGRTHATTASTRRACCSTETQTRRVDGVAA